MTLRDLLPALMADPWRLDLIRRYHPSVARFIPALERRYPHADPEPQAWHALYLAAATYRPGKQGFHSWLRIKMTGAMSRFARTARRRERAGAHLGRLDGGWVVDERYFYRD